MIKQKKLAFLSAIILLILCFTGCSSGKEIAVEINKAEIPGGVYTYYLDYILTHTGTENTAEAAEQALEMVKDYVAVNTLAAKENIRADYGMKADCAAKVDSYWNMYRTHYSAIGLTKQDIGKIFQSEELKLALLEHYYGSEGTIKKTTRKKLIKAFEEKYVGLNIIEYSLTTTDTMGNTVDIDNESKEAIESVFRSMQKQLNSGKNFEDIFENYNAQQDLISTGAPETYIFTSDTVSYGEGFFDRITKLDYSKADIFEYNGKLCLIYRVNLTDEKYNYFDTYRTAVFTEMHMKDVDELVAQLKKGFTKIDKHTAAIDNCIQRVTAVLNTEK